MYVRGIKHLLILNIRDFTRYQHIRVVHPQDLVGSSF